MSFMADDADHVVVGLGSVTDDAEAVAAYLRSQGKKVGVVGIGADDGGVTNAKALVSALEKAGVKHEPIWLLQGGRHEWPVWRHALFEVAPKLFR